MIPIGRGKKGGASLAAVSQAKQPDGHITQGSALGLHSPSKKSHRGSQRRETGSEEGAQTAEAGGVGGQ